MEGTDFQFLIIARSRLTSCAAWRSQIKVGPYWQPGSDVEIVTVTIPREQRQAQSSIPNLQSIGVNRMANLRP